MAPKYGIYKIQHFPIIPSATYELEICLKKDKIYKGEYNSKLQINVVYN